MPDETATPNSFAAPCAYCQQGTRFLKKSKATGYEICNECYDDENEGLADAEISSPGVDNS